MALVKCVAPFTFDVDGVPHPVVAGEVFDENDPRVKGREVFFVPWSPAFTPRLAGLEPVVEKATAEPGEKRRRKAD